MQFDLVFEGGGAKGMVFVGARSISVQQHNLRTCYGHVHRVYHGHLPGGGLYQSGNPGTLE